MNRYRNYGNSALAVLATLGLVALAGCDQAAPGDEIEWLREPLEAAWVPGADPLLAYTVAYDSRSTHRTALVVLDAGADGGFLQGAPADANGAAPQTPGTEVASAWWLWMPRATRIGERAIVVALAEDEAGLRHIERATWDDNPVRAARGPLAGTDGAYALDIAPCGTGACVVFAKRTGTGTALSLVRLDEEGDLAGDPQPLPELAGTVESLHVLPAAAEATPDVFAVTCEGCDALTYETWESALYATTGTLWHLPPAAAGPLALASRGSLVEPAAMTPTATGATFVFWRAKDEEPPACDPKGHCPTVRELVQATWTRDGGALDEVVLATSELAHARAVGTSPEGPLAFWRALDDVGGPDAVRVAADGAAQSQPLATTYTNPMLIDELSEFDGLRPFLWPDGLAALPDTESGGVWIATRYRALPPGGPDECGEDVRTGFWTARIEEDGALSQASEGVDTLDLGGECGGGGGSCTSAPATDGLRGGLAVAFLGLLLTATAFLRRR